jgi:hypothetical protein
MAFFLIQYDRPAGKILALQEYVVREEAYARRNDLERNKEDHIEVVVLEGGSLEDIKRTHSRYFLTLEELVDRLAS